MSFARNENSWDSWAWYVVSTDGVGLRIYAFIPSQKHQGVVGFVGLFDVD